jgi:hypothetical protein
MLRMLLLTIFGILFRTTYSWVCYTPKFHPQSRVHTGSVVLIGRRSGQVESWREYVPLVVSGLVLVDVAMGRPIVNAIMKPLSPQSMDSSGMDDNAGMLQSDTEQGRKRKERVDTERIAKEALEQAYASRDLRKYLEETKSDAQRLQEIRQGMDAQLKQIDYKLEQRRKELDE